MAKDVVTGLQVSRDLDHPAVAIFTEDIGSPLALGLVVAGTVDLEEPKGVLGDCRAVAVAVGKVVDDGTDVALRPDWVPLDINLVAGLDGSIALGIDGLAVADDVSSVELVGLDEAVVRVLSPPADQSLLVVATVPVDRGVVVPVVDAVDDDSVDIAVGSNEAGTSDGGEKGRLLSLDHFGGLGRKGRKKKNRLKI